MSVFHSCSMGMTVFVAFLQLGCGGRQVMGADIHNKVPKVEHTTEGGYKICFELPQQPEPSKAPAAIQVTIAGRLSDKHTSCERPLDAVGQGVACLEIKKADWESSDPKKCPPNTSDLVVSYPLAVDGTNRAGTMKLFIKNLKASKAESAKK